MELLERRKGLTEALNAHDATAVKSFVHPSFQVRDQRGYVAADYQQLLDQLATTFNDHPEYRQSLEIESCRCDGDSATLTSRRVENVKLLWLLNWNNVSRWEETWKKIGGQWVIVEEQPSPDQRL